jgi:hypothetical protein
MFSEAIPSVWGYDGAECRVGIGCASNRCWMFFGETMGIECFQRQCMGMSRGPDYGERMTGAECPVGVGCEINRQWMFSGKTVGIECFQKQYPVYGDIMQPR